MGYRYEVYEWCDITNGKGYCYRREYRGNSFLKAMFVMFRLKKAGVGCVKFEWR